MFIQKYWKDAFETVFTNSTSFENNNNTNNDK